MAQIPQPIKSNTLEGLFLELALLLQRYEQNEVLNPQKLNLINVTIDTDTKKATIAMAMNIDFDRGLNGGYIVAYPYLLDPTSP